MSMGDRILRGRRLHRADELPKPRATETKKPCRREIAQAVATGIGELCDFGFACKHGTGCRGRHTDRERILFRQRERKVLALERGSGCAYCKAGVCKYGAQCRGQTVMRGSRKSEARALIIPAPRKKVRRRGRKRPRGKPHRDTRVANCDSGGLGSHHGSEGCRSDRSEGMLWQVITGLERELELQAQEHTAQDAKSRDMFDRMLERHKIGNTKFANQLWNLRKLNRELKLTREAEGWEAEVRVLKEHLERLREDTEEEEGKLLEEIREVDRQLLSEKANNEALRKELHELKAQSGTTQCKSAQTGIQLTETHHLHQATQPSEALDSQPHRAKQPSESWDSQPHRTTQTSGACDTYPHNATQLAEARDSQPSRQKFMHEMPDMAFSMGTKARPSTHRQARQQKRQQHPRQQEQRQQLEQEQEQQSKRQQQQIRTSRAPSEAHDSHPHTATQPSGDCDSLPHTSTQHSGACGLQPHTAAQPSEASDSQPHTATQPSEAPDSQPHTDTQQQSHHDIVGQMRNDTSEQDCTEDNSEDQTDDGDNDQSSRSEDQADDEDSDQSTGESRTCSADLQMMMHLPVSHSEMMAQRGMRSDCPHEGVVRYHGLWFCKEHAPIPAPREYNHEDCWECNSAEPPCERPGSTMHSGLWFCEEHALTITQREEARPNGKWIAYILGSCRSCMSKALFVLFVLMHLTRAATGRCSTIVTMIICMGALWYLGASWWWAPAILIVLVCNRLCWDVAGIRKDELQGKRQRADMERRELENYKQDMLQRDPWLWDSREDKKEEEEEEEWRAEYLSQLADRRRQGLGLGDY